MRPTFLATLRCPACGGALRTDSAILDDQERLRFAVVACDCNQYPIIDRILRLIDDRLNAALVRLLRSGQNHEAFHAAWEWPSFSRWRRARNRLARMVVTRALPGHIHVANAIRGRHPALQATRYLDAASTFNSALEREWSVHRFSMPTFRPLFVLAGLVREGAVLDLGSGSGHGTSLLAQIAGGRNVVAVDNNFAPLHLAQRFFAPDAAFICADANMPLPFDDGYFSTTVCYDTFQYIDGKRLLSQELDRVTTADGLNIQRVHNGALPHEYGGKALTLRAYRRLFSSKPLVALTETETLARAAGPTFPPLDLTRSSPDAELESSPGICFLQTADRSRLQSAENPWCRFSSSGESFVLNPTYTPTGTARPDTEPATVRLERIPLSPAFEALFRATPLAIPMDGVMSSDELTGEQSNSRVTVPRGSTRLAELLREGFAIPVAKAFSES